MRGSSSLRSLPELQSGQAVDTAAVFLDPVGLQSFGAFALCPGIEHIALPHIVIEGDGVAAGAAYPGDLDLNKSAAADLVWKVEAKMLEAFRTRSVVMANAMKADDARGTLKGAEHDEDAPVFADMGDGLHAAAGEILIDHFHGAGDAQGVDAFGRTVYMPLSGEGCRGHKKHLLFGYPAFDTVVNFIQNFTHIELLSVFPGHCALPVCCGLWQDATRWAYCVKLCSSLQSWNFLMTTFLDPQHGFAPVHTDLLAPGDPGIAYAAVPERLKWWVDARLGVSYHWGAYSVAARGEWVRSIEELSVQEYQPYVDAFSADRYDPTEWAAAAAAMGAEYAVLTSKHHDGFCLFDSQLTDYTSVHAPAGRDLVAEYVEAFRDAGIRVGLYYSLVDWHHPEVPAFGDRQHPLRRDPAMEGKEHNWDVYIEYMHGQLRELMSNYGQIDLLVLDFSWYEYVGETWRATELMQMLRELQPDLVINDRLANAVDGNMKSALPPPWCGDFDTCELNMPHGLMRNEEGKAVPWDLWITHTNTWSSSDADTQWKGPEDVVRCLCNCVSKSGNLTLNFAPTARGELPEESLELQLEVGDWLSRNVEAVKGCFAAPLERPDWGRYTLSADGKTLFAHITEQPFGHLTLRGLRGKVRNPRILSSGHEAVIGDFWNLGVQAFGEKEDIFLNLRKPIQQTYILPDAWNTVIAMEVVPADEQQSEWERVSIDPHRRMVF